MPSVGNAFYPTISVTEAAAVATAVERDFRGSITITGLASHLGMTEKGGAFRHKVTALHRYGLFDGRGTLSVTPLGQQVAHPDSPAEHDVAIAEAFLNIDLFRRLRERFGDVLPAEVQLRIVIEELTSADRRDVTSVLTRLARLYADGLQYMQPSSTSRPSPEQAPPEAMTKRPSEGVTVSADPNNSIVLSDGSFRFPVERSPRGVLLLRKYLDLLEEQLRMETDAEEETGDDVA